MGSELAHDVLQISLGGFPYDDVQLWFPRYSVLLDSLSWRRLNIRTWIGVFLRAHYLDVRRFLCVLWSV
jgi:hypothetical protein